MEKSSVDQALTEKIRLTQALKDDLEGKLIKGHKLSLPHLKITQALTFLQYVV